MNSIVNTEYKQLGNQIVAEDDLANMAETSDPIDVFTKGMDSLPDCETEDSINCRWDATKGNGQGKSFVSIKNKQGGVSLFYEDGTTQTLEE